VRDERRNREGGGLVRGVDDIFRKKRDRAPTSVGQPKGEGKEAEMLWGRARFGNKGKKNTETETPSFRDGGSGERVCQKRAVLFSLQRRDRICKAKSSTEILKRKEEGTRVGR